MAVIVAIDEALALGKRTAYRSQPNYSVQRISSRTLAHHLESCANLSSGTKHPRVAMWSVANKPVVHEEKAGAYFGEEIGPPESSIPHASSCWPPATWCPPEHCYPFHHVDVVCIRRYHTQGAVVLEGPHAGMVF